jgi:hypothetical protein
LCIAAEGVSRSLGAIVVLAAVFTPPWSWESQSGKPPTGWRPAFSIARACDPTSGLGAGYLFLDSTGSLMVDGSPMNEMISSPAQRIEILKARTKAFRFPKGQSGNPDGQSRFYHECRKIAREASPDMMRGLVELAKTSEDDRVRSVCLVAVLDRAGLRPMDYDPNQEQSEPTWDPGKLTAEEREQLKAIYRKMLGQSRDG